MPGGSYGIMVIYMYVKQGSSPDRGLSPVEWGEIPSFRLSICLSVCPLRGLSQAQGGPSEAQGGPSEAQGGHSQAIDGQIQALGGPCQAVGGQSQGLEGQGSLSQALGGLC